MLFHLLDLLAGWWIDWRLSREVANNPELQEFGLKKVEFDETGFHLIASFPGVVMLADEAAAMLEANNAKNYVEFDMMPKLDRGKIPIRVTVQWANGISPSKKADILEDAWNEAINLYPDIEAILDKRKIWVE